MVAFLKKKKQKVYIESRKNIFKKSCLMDALV